MNFAEMYSQQYGGFYPEEGLGVAIEDGLLQREIGSFAVDIREGFTPRVFLFFKDGSYLLHWSTEKFELSKEV